MLGEGFLNAVLANSHNLIFVKDRDSRIVYANEAFLAVYSPEERDQVVGSTTVENFSESEAEVFLREDRRAFELGNSEMVEEIVDWKGDKRCLSTRKMVYKADDGRELLLAIATDISDLKSREHALTKANRQLRDYARSVAHDLRTPIAAVISGISIIERDPNSRLSERGAMVAKAIKDSAHGMSNHLTAMLDAAQSDGLGLTFVETDLNLLLEEVRFNLSALLTTRHARLQSSRLPTAVVEPTLFRQMMQSLIENGVRHSRVEEPVVTLRVKEEGGEFVFQFYDNGLGIPKEKRHLLMKPFTRGDDSEVGEGYGLGLMQCQRIAQLHEGYLELPERDPAEAGGPQPTIVARISSDLQPR